MAEVMQCAMLPPDAVAPQHAAVPHVASLPFVLVRSKSYDAAAIHDAIQQLTLVSATPAAPQASTDTPPPAHTNTAADSAVPQTDGQRQAVGVPVPDLTPPNPDAAAAAPVAPVVPAETDTQHATQPAPASVETAQPAPASVAAPAPEAEITCGLCFQPVYLVRVGQPSERESYSKDAVLCEHKVLNKNKWCMFMCTLNCLHVFTFVYLYVCVA